MKFPELVNLFNLLTIINNNPLYVALHYRLKFIMNYFPVTKYWSNQNLHKYTHYDQHYRIKEVKPYMTGCFANVKNL